MLRKARWLLRHHPDVMILADRGFANHDLLSWLQESNWHYCIRITCDTQLHGIRRHPIEASLIYPKKGEAAFYRNVGLWQDGLIRCNLVVAYPEGVSEHWAVITSGMAVQVAGLRQNVDPHWNRGLSYLKIGLRWLKGVIHKGRQLLDPIPLLPKDQEPCFASNKARQNISYGICFSRIYSLECKP